ncbi:DUF4062 domain-containing protein [Amycolatopsis vastitatis]|uniref:DUF4062 domain-containing protein n=1 Tax=Amycolatopsis vastitatis TaxID=1905142 RepID=UPI001178752D|nr:DUF4062 domain-containing protein [Amycolatopsis vastitatis]
MTFNATAVAVFIASPDDAAEARDAVERVIRRWNSDHAVSRGVVLLPIRWEYDSVAVLGRDPQIITNQQLVSQADIMIGIFNARLGTRTPRSISGTAEELRLGASRGIPVHVYFSSGPLDRRLDIDQLRSLLEYKASLQSNGILGEYGSISELETQVRSALEKDVRELLTLDIDRQGEQPLASIRVTTEFDQVSAGEKIPGKILLEAVNIGSVTAEDLRLDLEAIDGGEVPISRLDEIDSISLAPTEVFRFPVYSVTGMSKIWKVTARWREGESEFSGTYNLNI